MGDFRASIKIEFSMGSIKDHVDMWINWSPDDTGVDPRVTEWIEGRAEKAVAEIRENIHMAWDHPDDDDAIYMRDLDGTGSMHPCSKGDPGAIRFVRDDED
jgi:hypothetical protein